LLVLTISALLLFVMLWQQPLVMLYATWCKQWQQ
jgi:hypothetical protein